MSYSLVNIYDQTKASTIKALEEGLIVSPETFDKLKGVHPESGLDLNTPAFFCERMLEQHTAGLDISGLEKARIEQFIDNVLHHTLPEDLRDFLD